MNRKQQIAQLQMLGQMVLDQRLHVLETAARARQESLDRLAAMVPGPTPEDLPPIAAHQAEMRYESWAALRRREINLTLARQTAEMLQARDAAGLAFGRVEAMKALRRRHGLE